MLEVQNLQIGYKTIINEQALSASFDLGNLVVILGRNGCGKSTFLKTLGRFLPALKGTIYLQNKKIGQFSAKDFAHQLSLVTTERMQVPYLKVYDLVALGRHPYLGFLGKLREEDHQYIRSVLENLEILYLADKYVSDCSDGEQQMVLLARALAQDTPIILLDEATAHLDFVNRIKIFRTLKRLAVENNKLIFLATHELETALKYGHQVLLFQPTKITYNTPQFFIDNHLIQEVFAVEGIEY